MIDTGIEVNEIIQTLRLGIPLGRHEHYWQRFIYKEYAKLCTSNPLTKRGLNKKQMAYYK